MTLMQNTKLRDSISKLSAEELFSMQVHIATLLHEVRCNARKTPSAVNKNDELEMIDQLASSIERLLH